MKEERWAEAASYDVNTKTLTFRFIRLYDPMFGFHTDGIDRTWFVNPDGTGHNGDLIVRFDENKKSKKEAADINTTPLDYDDGSDGTSTDFNKPPFTNSTRSDDGWYPKWVGSKLILPR